ncbi:GIY-YIG nuclease family protein [Sediminibacterium goheungense]|uniref:Putative endonuclease n=1 Tax=Sediminibacterium goheungense TaxID=1086393 RepID=A0A4V6PSG9_9BACT|nr:GIY-YIG nuclease family protein [Sediminibacterium goheungense]TDO23424.1 putative endonuclease [Sediminibacterium goheungense]TDO23425.1 putative endonuclease [Sediminibacterium goheungense]TDO25027.1 putative endonuclease [Sediminibacterium goheungense]TDO25028.1 putative endonuclease [Sediminibacterium goheungense]
MFYAYVLFSLNKGIYYKGSTENLVVRVQQHNDGLVAFTSKYRPWKIVYYEVFSTRAEALKREKFFKSGKGREWLKNTLNNIS